MLLTYIPNYVISTVRYVLWRRKCRWYSVSFTC